MLSHWLGDSEVEIEAVVVLTKMSMVHLLQFENLLETDQFQGPG